MKLWVNCPPVTCPPVTCPPATCPPLTCPPVTCPPVTCPPVTCPPVTCPPVTCPPLTCPPLTCPPVTCPPVTCPPTWRRSLSSQPSTDSSLLYSIWKLAYKYLSCYVFTVMLSWVSFFTPLSLFTRYVSVLDGWSGFSTRIFFASKGCHIDVL